MSLGDATKFVLSSDAAEGNAMNRPVLPVAVPPRTAAAFENEYRYREQRDRGRDTRGDDKNLEHCARALHQLVRVGEEQCSILNRVLGKNAEVLLKQTELLNKMSTDARIAELRAVKWEAHAVRLQAELDELRDG